MKRLKLSSLIATLIFSVAIFSKINVAHAADNNTIYFTHEGGQNRYETCRKLIYRNMQTSFKYAVLVSGSNYPDSLSAAPLAKQYNAPIILLPVDSNNQSFLDEDTKELLRKHGVKQVFIIGGNGVISRTVDNALDNMKIDTTRISGQDRYETSIKVAQKLGSPSEAFVTTGEDYKDALSVSSIAAKKGYPIILTPSTSDMPDIIKDYFDNNKITKTYVIGGNNLISDSIFKQLPSAVRIDGSDAYERNANIINKFSSELSFTETYMASGEGFADGLGGSAIAAQTASPIILIKPLISSATSNLISSKRSEIQHITILGGEGAISNSTLSQIPKLKEQPYLNEAIKPYYAAFDGNNRDFYAKDHFTFGSQTYYGFQMANSYGQNINPYMSFDLDGKYKNITGKVGIARFGSEGILKVYGDDKLLNQFDVKDLNDLVSINIDVTDVTKLKFVFILSKGANEQNGGYIGLALIDTKIK